MDSFKATAYSYIKDKIITCQYKPGDVLDLNAIKNQLNISRTPVRDAITTLEQERFVTVLPRRGVLVANITPKDIGDLYMIREQLEPFIARLAVSLAHKEKLLQFKELFLSQSGNMRDFNRLDLEFHSYLIQLVGNPYISSVMNLVLDHNMRFVVLGAQLPNRLEHSNDEHVQILNALVSRDEKAAEELMREHIKYARVSAFESMSLSPAMVGNIHQDSAHKEYEK